MNMPRYFDSLHTLKVWTIYGGLMQQLYESYHRSQFPFVNGRVFRLDHKGYSDADITESLMNYSPLELMINDGKENTLTLNGQVVSATRVEEMPSAFVVVIRGKLSRRETVCEAVVVMYYGTSDGRGFCLVPEQARQTLYCSS